MQQIQSGPNPLPSSRMAKEERIEEIVRILAEGLKRILPEQSSSLSTAGEDSSFDILALKRRVGRRKLTKRLGEL